MAPVSSTRAAAAAAVLLLASVTVVRAQTGQTAQIPLQFDFLNPGAHSLALGSAFVAVAEDATTAFTNPAGLTLTYRPEISAELRYRTLDTPYLSGGRLSGKPSGGLDSVASPTYGISADSALRPYFIGFVYPIKRRKRVPQDGEEQRVPAAEEESSWSVAAYRHELVLQTNSFLSQGPFYSAGGGVIPNARLFGLLGDRDIRIVTYGASAAYKVSDHLSVGEGINFYRFSLDSHFASLGFIGDSSTPVDVQSAGQHSTTQQSGDGTQAAFNIGALVTLNAAFRIGAVYRQSASFLFTETINVPETPAAVRVGTFRTPGVLGVGARLQPWTAWTFSIDYDRVQYSHLTTHFVTFQVDPTVVDRVAIPDGNEIHFGTEYSFLERAGNLALRGGIWFDPNHSIQYLSDGTGSDVDTRLKAVFPGGANAWHYCGGFGITLSRALEVNVGADFASRRTYASASIVARFGKPRA
jgi:long-chain fatty acid transport protein